jgi:hypothetical protein
MMPYNFVMVNVGLIGADGSIVLNPGDIAFQPSDFIWDTTTQQIVFVPPIMLSATGAYNGNPVQVPFLAMDNPTLSTNWSWLISAAVPGVTVPVRKFAVMYASGPEQNLTDLLTASTVVVV